MRDKLEGRRPTDMTGTTLASAGGPLALPILCLLAILIIGTFTWMVADGRIRLPKPKADPVPITEKPPGARPESTRRQSVVVMRHPGPSAVTEGYVGSEMEKVVVGQYQSYTGDEDDPRSARTELIGKGGLHMDVSLSQDCQARPIEARFGRMIRVRADIWRTKDGALEKRLSSDDAEAALCGDFTGRDVARGTSRE